MNEMMNEKLLNDLVAKYVKQGYRVVSQTPTSAQLVMEKKFSCLLATLLFLLTVFPFFIYLFWYLAKKEQTLYLRIQERNDGSVIIITNHRGHEWVYGKSRSKQSQLKALRSTRTKKINGLPAWQLIILIISALAVLIIIFGYLLS